MIDLTSQFGRAVERHLQDEYVIWLTTIDSRLIPQPRPVWFLWENDSILIFSKPSAHKVKHVRQNPNVSLHFNTDETGDKHVIVVIGEAHVDANCPPAYRVHSYLEKYRDGILSLGMTPEGFGAEYSIAIRINPAEVRGWE